LSLFGVMKDSIVFKQFFFHFLEKLKPKREGRIDWMGTCLYYALPVVIFCMVGFSLFPFVMPPEFNYVNSFVIHVFKFESEKTKFWLLFRIFYFIVVCADTFVSLGTIFMQAMLASLVIYVLTSWLSHLETVICSKKSVQEFLHFYNILRVLNIIIQLFTRLLAPVLIGSSFFVSLICNVIALSMFSKMDTLIYIFCVSCGSIFLVVTVKLMQFASQSVEHSASCHKKCDNVIFGYKTKLIRKKLKSLPLIGFEVGSFYLLTINRVLIYGYHMMDKTVGALLLS